MLFETRVRLWESTYDLVSSSETSHEQGDYLMRARTAILFDISQADFDIAYVCQVETTHPQRVAVALRLSGVSSDHLAALTEVWVREDLEDDLADAALLHFSADRALLEFALGNKHPSRRTHGLLNKAVEVQLRGASRDPRTSRDAIRRAALSIWRQWRDSPWTAAAFELMGHTAELDLLTEPSLSIRWVARFLERFPRGHSGPLALIGPEAFAEHSSLLAALLAQYGTSVFAVDEAPIVAKFNGTELHATVAVALAPDGRVLSEVILPWRFREVGRYRVPIRMRLGEHTSFARVGAATSETVALLLLRIGPRHLVLLDRAQWHFPDDVLRALGESGSTVLGTEPGLAILSNPLERLLPLVGSALANLQLPSDLVAALNELAAALHLAVATLAADRETVTSAFAFCGLIPGVEGGQVAAGLVGEGAPPTGRAAILNKV